MDNLCISRVSVLRLEAGLNAFLRLMEYQCRPSGHPPGIITPLRLLSSHF